MLTEGPEVVRDNVAMKGETIIYDLTSDQFSVEKPKMRIEQPSATGKKG